MKAESGSSTTGGDFGQSINEVLFSPEQSRTLPNRTRLLPVSGAGNHSILGDILRPSSLQKKHLETILRPPDFGLEKMSPGQFNMSFGDAIQKLRLYSEDGSSVVDKALKVLDSIEDDRKLLELEFIKLLDV